MAEDYTFRRQAQRPVAMVEGPTLQWATGLPTKDRTIYAGWLIEAGKLDDLDSAMDAAGFKQVTIKHGSGNLVTHWAVPRANVFVLADSIQSIADMKHSDRITGIDKLRRYGVAFGWRTLDGGRQQSVLKVRVLLRELAMHDYLEPIVLSVKSTLTGDVLAALTRQYDVLEQVDAFRALDGKPPIKAPLYAASLPIVAGGEIARGKQGQTKEIAPPLADVPAPITKDYIRQHWGWRALAAHIEERLIDDAIIWSCAESQRIIAGDENAQPQRQPEHEESLI
jgi:hypothetical protein